MKNKVLSCHCLGNESERIQKRTMFLEKNVSYLKNAQIKTIMWKIGASWILVSDFDVHNRHEELFCTVVQTDLDWRALVILD